MSEPSSITPRKVYERLRSREPTSILDARDRGEYETWRIDAPSVMSAQVPYARFVQAQVTGGAADLVPGKLEEPVIVVCPRGEASAEIANALAEEGIEALNLDGGMNAWADLLVGHEVTRADCDVVQYERPATGCLSYLVVAGDEAAVIDPLRAFADRYVASVEDRDADLRYAVDTHVHADHVSGVRAVAEQADAIRVLPTEAADRGLDYDARLVEGESIPLGERDLTFHHAPGHTSDLQVIRAGNVAFTADCLFLDSVGRPDLEVADAARDLADQLYDSLHEIVFEFPDDALIAPGHVESDTETSADGSYTRPLAEVRDGLGLATLDREAFVDRVTTDLPPRPENHETIASVNLGKRTLDQQLLELELGPNNCAVS